jgi:signal peptidase I
MSEEQERGVARPETEGARMDGSTRRDDAGSAPVDAVNGAKTEGEEPAADKAEASGETPSGATASADDGSGADTSKSKPATKRRRSFWKELPVLVVVALVLAVLIKTYALQAFYIPSGSMENTLEIGDRVLINKLVYDLRGIHRGDVIVFNGAGSWDPELSAPSSNPFTRFFTDIGQMIGVVHGEDDYVKRVIGLPGDHVACCNAQGQITVNNVALDETSYLYPGNAPSEQRFSIVVPAGRLWVMGDHRAISYDSRGHMGDPGGGTIPENQVLGEVFVRIWPLSRWAFLSTPSTFDNPKLNESLGSSASTEALKLADKTGVLKVAGAPEFPLVLGFGGAVPLTLAQRKLRKRLGRRASRRQSLR